MSIKQQSICENTHSVTTNSYINVIVTLFHLLCSWVLTGFLTIFLHKFFLLYTPLDYRYSRVELLR